MIAHPLKTVFVHIPKTAGQSVEQVFLSYLGLDQQSRRALLLREKRSFETGPPRLAHLTAAEYMQHGFLSQADYEEYFSFSFVRNPWARVQSFYRYLKLNQKLSFRDFVLNELEGLTSSEKYGWFVKSQAEYIYNHDNILQVDFLGRFENLQADFDHVLQHLGLPCTELPVINVSHSSSQNSERADQFDSATRDKVAELYARDIELLDYDADDLIG